MTKPEGNFFKKKKKKMQEATLQNMITQERLVDTINSSSYISRDLSWLNFNYRVLEQAKSKKRTIFDRLKFLAITASNLDEFFMIRIGSLYNYLDYNRERIDYSGLRERPFRKILLQKAKEFTQEQNNYFQKVLLPECEKHYFNISNIEDLSSKEQEGIADYFMNTIFPMLTPMAYDNYRSFPLLMNKVITFGIVTKSIEKGKEDKKLSFLQVPQNLPRFYEFYREDTLIFVPIEDIIRWQIQKLYRNIEILSVSLFRITRNGDVTLEESDDIEEAFIHEIKQALKGRKTGRVVRLEVEKGYSDWMMQQLLKYWKIDEDNMFETESLIDYTGLFQVAGHDDFKDRVWHAPPPIPPVNMRDNEVDLFEYLKDNDMLLHHPYNSIEPLLQLLERAAEDPDVLAIKITIYRLSKKSRVTKALLKAAENGKHISVLFELKARFDEENNIREAELLQKAGCFVIYGINRYKTHTKMLLIVRKEATRIRRYVHFSSGNYNESTSKLYTDTSLLTTNEVYAHDVSEFFNAITGHSEPHFYRNIITAPRDMRQTLIDLIQQETQNALNDLPSGIVIKVNSLEDRKTIDELYKASKAGVPIKLIVRGICCLRPNRKDLSENIIIHSIVGDFLEHSRIYYFHNNGDPKVYGGSADVMVRSFDRRIESLFIVNGDIAKKTCICILNYSLKDNMNTYIMQENGEYIKRKLSDEAPFDVHREFFYMNEKSLEQCEVLF